jgi:hypothetical protein
MATDNQEKVTENEMNELYKPADIKTMSPVTKEIGQLLASRGYTLYKAGRMDNTDINGLIINRLEYRCEGESVFFTTQEKSKREES